MSQKKTHTIGREGGSVGGKSETERDSRQKQLRVRSTRRQRRADLERTDRLDRETEAVREGQLGGYDQENAEFIELVFIYLRRIVNICNQLGKGRKEDINSKSSMCMWFLLS